MEVEIAWAEERTIAPTAFLNLWQAKVSRPHYVEQLQMEVTGGANNGNGGVMMTAGIADSRGVNGYQGFIGYSAEYPGADDDVPRDY